MSAPAAAEGQVLGRKHCTSEKMGKRQMKAAGYAFDNDATCRGCGADIVRWIYSAWKQTTDGPDAAWHICARSAISAHAPMRRTSQAAMLAQAGTGGAAGLHLAGRSGNRRPKGDGVSARMLSLCRAVLSPSGMDLHRPGDSSCSGSQRAGFDRWIAWRRLAVSAAGSGLEGSSRGLEGAGSALRDAVEGIEGI